MIPTIPKVPLGNEDRFLPQYFPRMSNVPPRSGYRTIPDCDDIFFTNNDIINGVLDHGDYRVFVGIWKNLIQQVSYGVSITGMPWETTVEREYIRYLCGNCSEITNTLRYVESRCPDCFIVMRKESELASMATSMGIVAALLKEKQPMLSPRLSVAHLNMKVPSVLLSFFTKELHDHVFSAEQANESVNKLMSRYGQPHSRTKRKE